MSKIFAEVIPENYLPNGYTEYNNVDFVISGMSGEVLDLGSLRILGELEVTHGTSNEPLNSASNYDKQILYDPFVASHSFIESLQVEVNGEIIESLSEYGRLVKMVTCSTESQAQQMNASNVCQLKVPFAEMSNAVLKGEVVKNNSVAGVRVNPDFACRLMCCLNSVDGHVPFSRVGDIRLTINMARVNSALYGADVDGDTKYTVKNLRLAYTKRPDDGSHNDPTVLKTMLNIKSSIQSSFSNNSTKVPAVCSSVSCSFNYQADENTALNNNFNLVKIPNVTQVQFTFNSSTNEYISYVIRDDIEVIDRFITSFRDMGVNALSNQNLTDNQGYGIGLDFGGDMIDLRQQAFNTQITSSLSSSTPLIMYMYFHSVASI